jgi:hypothetical protein
MVATYTILGQKVGSHVVRWPPNIHHFPLNSLREKLGTAPTEVVTNFLTFSLRWQRSAHCSAASTSRWPAVAARRRPRHRPSTHQARRNQTSSSTPLFLILDNAMWSSSDIRTGTSWHKQMRRRRSKSTRVKGAAGIGATVKEGQCTYIARRFAWRWNRLHSRSSGRMLRRESPLLGALDHAREHRSCRIASGHWSRYHARCTRQASMPQLAIIKSMIALQEQLYGLAEDAGMAQALD